MNNPKVNEALSEIVKMFESGTVPEAVNIVTFPNGNVPCRKWSLGNRMLLWLSRTQDARGFKQWKSVGRHVKKGAKAVWILAPVFVKKQTVTQEKQPDGCMTEKIETRQILVGFKAVPVFKVEDTEGKPLEYQKLDLPKLPLSEVAQAWNIKVQPAGFEGHVYGWFRPGSNEITLATADEEVWFHELAHVVEHRLGHAKCGQEPLTEIVAELSAACLARMVGRKVSPNMGEHFKYLQNYATKLYPRMAAKEAVGRACWRVFSRVGAVVEEIMKASGDAKLSAAIEAHDSNEVLNAVA